MFADKVSRVNFDQVSDPSEFVHDFFIRSCCFCRIRKVLVKAFYLAWEIRTGFVCIVTYGDHCIKMNRLVFIYVVRSVG